MKKAQKTTELEQSADVISQMNKLLGKRTRSIVLINNFENTKGENEEPTNEKENLKKRQKKELDKSLNEGGSF